MKVFEWHCQLCDHPFDAYSSLCPKCSRPAKRAYRTAPGYVTRGLVKKIDAVLGAELHDRGLSDLPKPREYRESEPFSAVPLVTGSTCSGSGQVPVKAGWGKGALDKTNETFGTNFVSPFSQSGVSSPLSDESSAGPSRDYVRKHTQIVARIDAHGDRIG